MCQFFERSMVFSQSYLGTMQPTFGHMSPLSRLASPVALYLRSVLDGEVPMKKKDFQRVGLCTSA